MAYAESEYSDGKMGGMEPAFHPSIPPILQERDFA